MRLTLGVLLAATVAWTGMAAIGDRWTLALVGLAGACWSLGGLLLAWARRWRR
jgi:hypothetical protein